MAAVDRAIGERRSAVSMGWEVAGFGVKVGAWVVDSWRSAFS